MINGKAAYELKGKFLDDLRNNDFSETNGEDEVEHIENFLKIVDPLNLPNTYEEYENEMNNYPEEPWSENRVPYELIDHICEPLRFKNGKTKWPTCSSKEDRFCNGGELPRMVRVEYWWKMNDHECSPLTNWKSHIHETYVITNIDANYNLYLDVSRTFNNHEGRNDEEVIQEEREPNDDHGIGNLDNDLVRDNASFHANKEEEQYEEDRCELLGNPCQELPVCKIGRFKVIKYSFGPAEKYITIKECEYDNLTRTEEDSCHTHQGIFHIMDEGWFVTRAG
ncbi:hypothetical protein Tco_0687751 [Tanacetum coccineum]